MSSSVDPIATNMSYSVEYFQIDLAHFLFLVPLNLPTPPHEGATFETQVRRFVGATPPPSFRDFPASPAPPSGESILDSFARWSCVRHGVRYEAHHFDTPEPTIEPETWTIKVTRYPVALEGSVGDDAGGEAEAGAGAGAGGGAGGGVGASAGDGGSTRQGHSASSPLSSGPSWPATPPRS